MSWAQIVVILFVGLSYGTIMLFLLRPPRSKPDARVDRVVAEFEELSRALDRRGVRPCQCVRWEESIDIDCRRRGFICFRNWSADLDCLDCAGSGEIR